MSNLFGQRFVAIFSFIWLGILSFPANAEITGAGSSLAYPVMKELTMQYQAQKKIEVKYNSVGSGQGIVQMTARAVDFSLSDIPLTQYELTTQNLIQFPVFASAIVPVYNLPGLSTKSLVLNGPVLADIYLGRVSQWNDRAIQLLNPTLVLPDLPIKVVYRSDISGSSYFFTRFLSTSSTLWNARYGIGSKLSWPVGEGVKGSLSVQEIVQNTPGGLGYLEYGSAISASLGIANISVGSKNVIADPNTFSETFSTLGPVRPSFYQYSSQTSDKSGWPIVAITYVLLPKKPNADDAVIDCINFFNWIYQTGAPTIRSFNLLPVENKRVLGLINAEWRSIITPKGKAIWNGGNE